jgi:hypothetical protein
MGDIRVGAASWTDRTLIAPGWYPHPVGTPAMRLRFYAEHFPLVEVDATLLQPGRGQDLLPGAAQCRRPAHGGHGAPRPQRGRPSVRWMKLTRTGRGWKDRALRAASARMGEAPGAKLNR